MQEVLLVYLDRYHQGDVFLVQALGHALARLARSRRPVVVVHGSGEFVERALESDGFFVDGAGPAGLNEPGIREKALVAIRELNHRLVSAFTESLAPAVGVQAADRRLLNLVDGSLSVDRIEWLRSQVMMPSVPVVSLVAAGEDGAEFVATSSAIRAFIDVPEIRFLPVLFTTSGLPGVMDGAIVRDTITGDDPRVADLVAEPDILEMLILSGSQALLTNAARLGHSGHTEGTILLPMA